jgi:thiol-disulfide isomerase/thioredoxin
MQQSKAPHGWQTIGIDVGNVAAENTITKVCNPYCGPCAKMHPVLEEIIRQNENVKLKIIFNARNVEDDIDAVVVRHLLGIAEENGVEKTIQALDDSYLADVKDYPVFAAKYPVGVDL